MVPGRGRLADYRIRRGQRRASRSASIAASGAVIENAGTVVANPLTSNSGGYLLTVH